MSLHPVTYITKTFRCYENEEMDAWLASNTANDYRIHMVKACGSSSILIIMWK
jgi:hypothetical protein